MNRTEYRDTRQQIAQLEIERNLLLAGQTQDYCQTQRDRINSDYSRQIERLRKAIAVPVDMPERQRNVRLALLHRCLVRAVAHTRRKRQALSEAYAHV